MEVNPTDRTRRSPDRVIRRARFRRGPAVASQPSEETCRCTSFVSTSTAPTTSKSSLTQRSGLFGVCLNCPADDRKPCSSCSVMIADSQDRSSVMTTGVIATGTIYEDEGSVYNGKGKIFSEFWKPSTTTAMTTPGAEEATVYNGKIGAFLFSGNQLDPHQTTVSTATDADMIRMLPSSSSPAIHTTDAATEEQKATIFMTSPMSDYPMSSDKPGRSKRRWQGNMTEDGNGTDQLPENNDVQEYPGTAVQLPAQPQPGNPSRNKRRKKERRHERVPAATSEKQPIPPDPHGYRWWKCGQKNIKGSPYPRSYYKCRTGSNCDVRREVMRDVDDPSMLDITYIGEHSHANPAAAAAAAAAADDIVPAEPVEESATTKLIDFVEYL